MLQPSLPYIMLKFSLQLYHRSPGELTNDEYEIVRNQARDEWALHEKILNSPERSSVVIPEQSITEAMQAIGARYETAESFEQDLRHNKMDSAELKTALEAELTVEAITAIIARGAAPVTEEQVAAALAKAKQKSPEQRLARHILITINDDFPENRRENAQARINSVRTKTIEPNADFNLLAERYSECPSALKGGFMGAIIRSRIDPRLGDILFTMQPGEISEIVESDMGFHILYCEKIIPAKSIAKEELIDHIRQTLLQKSRKRAVQAWLAAL